VLDAAVADMRSCGVSTVAGIQGDVRKPEDVERWVRVATAPASSSALDVLVNCAAGNFLAAADALSANGFRTVLDIDAVGTFSTSRAALPALKRAAERNGSGGGGGGGGASATSSSSSSPVIINISATLHYGATWWQAHACAAKAAVDALTRSLALEWGEFGVRVCGVAPGPIAGTAGLSKLSGSGGKGDGIAEAIAALVPLGRLGSAWDIAMACVWLSSAGSRFTSGDTLVVDGAAWLWRPPAVPRAVVAEVSRKVEAGSRAMTKVGAGAAAASRL
jgi:2,4-dienoyl-CoA reductase [(3E)-enoyl-CoA-producing], peroxisomal